MGASHFKVVPHHIWENILYVTAVQFRVEFLSLGTMDTWSYKLLYCGSSCLVPYRVFSDFSGPLVVTTKHVLTLPSVPWGTKLRAIEKHGFKLLAAVLLC